MVQRVFLSIIILAGSIFCSAQWTDIIPETSGVFRVIQFKNPAEGLILGDEGVVLRTTDGGKTWYYCPNSLDINFFGFQFMNDILICTYGSDRLYYSTDFGSTWTEKSPLPSATEHVNFLNRETAFASGNYNGMYKSSDSRATWNITWKYPDEENMFSDPNSTVFLNDSVGFACGRVFKSHTGLFGNVLKTTDGGSSWSVIYEDPPYGTNLIQLNITDDSVVYALDESFELVRSENLGESWSRISFNEPEGSRIMDMKATSACFLNTDTIVVISETDVWCKW